VASHIWTVFVLGEDRAFEAGVGRIGDQVGLNRVLMVRLREMWEEKVGKCLGEWLVWRGGWWRQG